jgi:hypothetical protein
MIGDVVVDPEVGVIPACLLLGFMDENDADLVARLVKGYGLH